MEIRILGSALKYLRNNFSAYLTELGHKVEVFNIKEQMSKIQAETPSFSSLSDKKFDLLILFQIYGYYRELGVYIKEMRGNSDFQIFDNGLFYNNYAINKVTDLTKLAFEGLPVPLTYNFKSLSSIDDITKLFSLPFVAKKTNMAKGKGVHLIKNRDNLQDLLKVNSDQKLSTGKYLFQDFIDYKTDLRVLVMGDKTFCMERIPAKGEFRANFSLGGKTKPYDLDDNLKHLAVKASKTLGLTVSGVDILIDKEDNPYILEVNHNPGFSGMEKALGENMSKHFFETILKSVGLNNKLKTRL